MSENPSTIAEIELRIAQAFRQLRLDAAYSQQELADRAGVSRSAVQSLEAGRGTQLANLIRVLRALGRLDLLDAFTPREGLSPMEVLALQRKAEKQAKQNKRVKRVNSGL